MVFQAQFCHIGASLHTRTPVTFRIPSEQLLFLHLQPVLRFSSSGPQLPLYQPSCFLHQQNPTKPGWLTLLQCSLRTDPPYSVSSELTLPTMSSQNWPSVSPQIWLYYSVPWELTLPTMSPQIWPSYSIPTERTLPTAFPQDWPSYSIPTELVLLLHPLRTDPPTASPQNWHSYSVPTELTLLQCPLRTDPL